MCYNYNIVFVCNGRRNRVILKSEVMAKKRKTTRKSAKKDQSEIKSSINFWRGVGAISLIIASIVLLFGAFISAPIPAGFWDAAWWTLGAAAIVAPLVLIYLGLSKFLSEDQQIPLTKMAGSIGLLVFFASWLHVAFLSTDAATGSLAGGHGGEVGSTVGDVLMGALGKFLASLIFFVLTVFAVFFTFG